MSNLILNDAGDPTAPASGKSIIYSDTAGDLRRRLSDGRIERITSQRPLEYLLNREFQYAQRQVPSAATTYSSTSTRVYSADRWSHTNENASMQFANVDASGSLDAALVARFYGRFTKLTNQGKIEIFQIVESAKSHHLRGRRVRFSMKAKNFTGSHTLRMAVLETNSGASADSSTGTTVTAHNAAATNPTLGSAFGYIVPDACSANASIVSSAVTCVLTSTWQTFSGTFTIPSTALNVTVMVFTDNRPVANDVFGLTEMSLAEGDEVRPYIPRDAQVEYNELLRFHCKTLNLATAEAQNQGAANGRYTTVAVTSNVARQYTFTLPVAMRRVPTSTDVVTYNPSAANVQARNIQTGTDSTGMVFLNASETSFAMTITGAAGWTAGEVFNLCWSVDVEI